LSRGTTARPGPLNSEDLVFGSCRSGSAWATFASRKIRASAAVEGTGVIPKSRIFSWTLIGP
jgi:hypothetical protein